MPTSRAVEMKRRSDAREPERRCSVIGGDFSLGEIRLSDGLPIVGAPRRGAPYVEWVAVAPPERLAHWLSTRGYLPEGVPLLKHVAAKAGQRTCRIGDAVSVDGRRVAIARARDGQGRPLPVWQGCRTLRSGELLLLNPAHPDSLDGRYFGPLPASAVIGRATPLYLRAPSPSPSTPEAKEIGHANQYL